MEVKIGVQHAPREIVLESAEDAEQVLAAVREAVRGGTVLELADERGRRVVVPGDRLAYVEVGEALERRVGFGAL